MIRNIRPAEAKRLLESDEGYQYIDVRTPEEFENGHVPGAINIPIALPQPGSGQMALNESFMPTVQAQFPSEARLILGCRSGGRSAAAANLLAQHGYQTLCNLEGGFCGKTDMFGRVIEPGWVTLGYPIERSEPER
ncbi:MAG TPA: rhodanese-like domain-containing protein [Phycisphaerae bacterium]|jgi:rhodanese-related sulfurtransferase